MGFFLVHDNASSMMDRLKFYVVHSTKAKPEELCFAADVKNDHDTVGKANARGRYDIEGILPLPLPEFLLIFALGDWPDDERCQRMCAQLHLGQDLDPFNIGILSKENRAVCWQGNWREDLQVRAALMSDDGQPGLLVITPTLPEALTTWKEYNSQDINRENMETSQTESQITDAVEGLCEDAESSRAPTGDSRLNESDAVTEKQTPTTATRRRIKAELTPEVAAKISSPPTITSAGRKKRKSSTEQSTPRDSSRVKRLQLQQSSASVKNRSSPGNKQPGIKASNDEPSARWGHSMCAISNKQAVVIGGQGENQVLSRDSVWILDTDEMKWCVPAITQMDSSKPQYRMGHTAVYDSTVQCMYVYGGSKNLRWYNDVHVLDIESWRWSLVKASGRAPTRAYHTSTLHHGEMYVFGGVYPNPDPEPDGCSDQLHVFNPATESWYEPLVMGTKPRARSGHSATLLGDRLVIFGGWDAPECFNDVHCLDLTLMEFTSIPVTGTPPSPRSWHASAALRGKRILIQGGFDGEKAMTDSFVFCLDKKSWTTLLWPICSSPTTGHTILTMSKKDNLFSDESDDKENDNISSTAAASSNRRLQKLFVFGGGNNEGAFSNRLVSFTLQLPSDA